MSPDESILRFRRRPHRVLTEAELPLLADLLSIAAESSVHKGRDIVSPRPRRAGA